MPRVKAIFDTDILIHLLQAEAIDFAISSLGVIYIGDYVYQQEIKKDTPEGREIEKLKNRGKIRILEYGDLTFAQKKVYTQTYKLLKKEEISSNPAENSINEGERVTACFAKACNIYYYMSDDNRAAASIKSLAAVEIINYCDILFLYLFSHGKDRIEDLRLCYTKFIALFDTDKIPRVLKGKSGTCFTFEEMMAKCFDRFNDSQSLRSIRDNIKINVSHRLNDE